MSNNKSTDSSQINKPKPTEGFEERVKRIENEVKLKDNPELLKLAQRKRELENEINDITNIINSDSNKINEKNLPVKDPWYYEYPVVKSLFTSKDFKNIQETTTLLAITGVFVGGIIGFKDGSNYMKQSISKAIHNPLVVSQLQMNSNKVIGTMVIRTSLIYCYRISLFGFVFKGVEASSKNLFFNGKENVLSTTIGGTAVGILAGSYTLKRSGRQGMLTSILLGTLIGFGSGIAYQGLDYFIGKKDDNIKLNENKTVSN